MLRCASLVQKYPENSQNLAKTRFLSVPRKIMCTHPVNPLTPSLLDKYPRDGNLLIITIEIFHAELVERKKLKCVKSQCHILERWDIPDVSFELLDVGDWPWKLIWKFIWETGNTKKKYALHTKNAERNMIKSIINSLHLVDLCLTLFWIQAVLGE